MSQWQNWALIGVVLLTFSGIAGEKPKTRATIPPTNSTEAPPTKPGPTAAEPLVPYWPQFHGPKGDNISLETGLLKKWPEKGPKLLWSRQWTSTAISNGRRQPVMLGQAVTQARGVPRPSTMTDSTTKARWGKSCASTPKPARKSGASTF